MTNTFNIFKFKIIWFVIIYTLIIFPVHSWKQGDHILFTYDGQDISGIVVGINNKKIYIMLEKDLHSLELDASQIKPIKWEIGNHIECRSVEDYNLYFEGQIIKFENTKYFFGFKEKEDLTLQLKNGEQRIFNQNQCRVGYINFKGIKTQHEEIEEEKADHQSDEVPDLTGNLVEDGFYLEDINVRYKILNLIQEHEKRTTDQIVVLIKSGYLYENTIEQYSHKVAETWKLGQKRKDNGILIVIMPALRKARIEVGYGLEGYLTDITCNRILNETMIPKFKVSKWEEGIAEGISRIIKVIDQKEPLQEATFWEIFWSFEGLEGGIQLSKTTRFILGFLISLLGLVWSVQLMFNLKIPLFPWFFIILFFIFIPAVFSGAIGILYYSIIHFLSIPIRLSGKFLPKLKKFQENWTNSSSVQIRDFDYNVIRDGSDSRGANGNTNSRSYSGGGGSFGGGGATGSW